jgi:hypothetical protein
MKKLITISIMLSIAIIHLSAQPLIDIPDYYIDGLRNSQYYYGSTARVMALGGAFASLGGDLGSISVNPAGVGVYRSSEFSFTPTYIAINTSSNYLNAKRNDIKYNFKLGSIGAVFTFNTPFSGGWENTNFAIGYNRLNTISSSYSIEGNISSSNSTSLTDQFLYNANKSGVTDPNSLDAYWEGLAYDAFVIDTVPGTDKHKYFSPFTGINLIQNHNVNINGSAGEYYFAYGANYNHQLYVGASINIISAHYSENFTHTEYNNDTVSYLDYFSFSHNISTWSTGFNFKIGVIYRPSEMFRIGFALHTPTITKISQEANSRIFSQMTDGTYYDINYDYSEIPTLTEEYNISSPLRAILGGAVMFQQVGLISIDYEMADYRTMHFSEGNNVDGMQAANDLNKKMFKVAHNIRIGGELKLSSLYLRGGYAYYASPYASSEGNKNAYTSIYSGGIGYRNNDFSLDFTYSLSDRSDKYYMYTANGIATNLNTQVSNFAITAGFRF